MQNFDVIIIGGGASGIVASLEAKKNYDKVAVIEKENKLGRKILATGNGKCNMTNIKTNIKDYHGSFSYCVKNLYREFSPKFITEYFKNLGLYTFSDDFGRVYPKCKQASAVLNILISKMIQNDISVFADNKVVNISVDNKFTVTTNNNTFSCDKLIIATGGKSSKNLGSDGSLFPIIENLGHTITKLKPALCPINVKSDLLKTIKGVRCDGTVSVLNKGKVIGKSSGEIQFTENSISGICAFDLSYLQCDKVRVSLMENYDKIKIIDILTERRKIFKNNSIEDFFLGMFNNKLSIAILKYCKMWSVNRKCADISNKELEQLAYAINHFDFQTTGNNDFTKSQVTHGGVLGSEINSETLESLFIPNLYFCGEVLDIDGICGGHNLQFAFASGMKAGGLL